ncbi:MAG: LysR family transcriptional regulator [Gammaproteobacteria bacterium]|nr:LysR family transcriptional regulator [Gammaproteobacteria bacterium]
MHFDFIDLRLFCNIAETQNMTHGAKKSFISTAAASSRIKNMEQQLGAKLLYRHTRGIELTAVGNTLLQHARLILKQANYMKNDLSEMNTGMTGHIRILANTTAVTDFLPQILSDFLVMHPGVTIDLQERVHRDIVRAVVNGSTDIGISAGLIHEKNIESKHLSTDKLVLATPLEHPLSEYKSVLFADLLPHHQICLHDGTSLVQFLKEQALEMQQQLNIRIQISSFDAMCRMVEAGVGVAILPQSAALRQQQTCKIKIIKLDEPWAIRKRVVLAREFAALPQYLIKLIDLLVERQAGES